MSAVRLNVNGRDCDVADDPAASLLSVLRDELHLTGAKPGCGEGQCGACTVLVEGQCGSLVHHAGERNGFEEDTDH